MHLLAYHNIISNKVHCFKIIIYLHKLDDLHFITFRIRLKYLYIKISSFTKVLSSLKLHSNHHNALCYMGNDNVPIFFLNIFVDDKVETRLLVDANLAPVLSLFYVCRQNMD